MSMDMIRLDPPDVGGCDTWNRCDKCMRFVAVYEQEEHWALGAMMGSEPGDDFHTVQKKAPCRHCDIEGWKRYQSFIGQGGVVYIGQGGDES